MTIVRCVYSTAPNFPATDQHPQAVRFTFVHPVRGTLFADCIGGAPIQSEIDAVLNPPPRLVQDEQERLDCKSDGTIVTLINKTRAEWRTWAAANFPSLTGAEQIRLGDLFWVVAVAVRRLIRNGN